MRTGAETYVEKTHTRTHERTHLYDLSIKSFNTGEPHFYIISQTFHNSFQSLYTLTGHFIRNTVLALLSSSSLSIVTFHWIIFLIMI